MKQRWICLIVLLATLLACSAPAAVSTPRTVTAIPPNPATAAPAASTAAPAPPAPTPPAASAGPIPTPLALATTQPFSILPITEFTPGASFQGVNTPLPPDLTQVINPQVASGLADPQKSFLVQNGFTVLHSQEEQFSDIRRQVATLDGQPYFLTVDAAYHALHLDFDELLKALERETLRPQMISMLQSTSDWIRGQSASIQDPALQKEIHLTLAYLGVAQKLFDPKASLNPDLESQVNAQVDQIMAGAGRDHSALFPDFEDDYGAYKPVGHYAGDADLEAYFRGMTWLDRVNFKIKALPPKPPSTPSRVPLILTLALNQSGQMDTWIKINDALTFLVGPTDDGGPQEYAVLMEAVYGSQPDLTDLTDLAKDDLWQKFQAMGPQLPLPKINSTFASTAADLADQAGFRFLGQRFVLDSYVLQMLVFDNVQELNGKKRELPTGLDVMAALGSATAMETLQKNGDTAYPGYMKNMADLQQAFRTQPPAEWQSHAAGSWLQAFAANLTQKDASFPAFMRTSAWGYHELNSALGSWAELKHDTALYTKMPEAFGGGGPPSSAAPPSYVEANPQVFYRLAFVAQSIGEGLALRDMDNQSADIQINDPLPLSVLASGIARLGGKFKSLGDIAAKELAGQPISSDDNDTITSCLGSVECRRLQDQLIGRTEPLPPVPIVAAVAGAQDSVLEAATEKVDRIYVVVPLDGKLQIAQGGVFSYTELVQPRSDRLTDQQWLARLESGSAPPLPDWSANFIPEGGGSKPSRWLALRAGDVYLINQAGDQWNMRASPSTQADIVNVLKKGDYIEIVDGPAKGADQQMWWKVKLAGYGESMTGWIVENRDWLDRAWGQ